MSTTYELYYYPECPYCQKVLRYLDQAGIGGTIALRDIHADAEAAATLVRVGGKRQVPCLFVDGQPMYESDDIVAYLKRNVA